MKAKKAVSLSVLALCGLVAVAASLGSAAPASLAYLPFCALRALVAFPLRVARA
jgi:hypothetical protein